MVKAFLVKLQEQLLTIVLWKICPKRFSKTHGKTPIPESRFSYVTPPVDYICQEPNGKTRERHKYLEWKFCVICDIHIHVLLALLLFH